VPPLRSVCVYAGSSPGAGPAYAALAAALGTRIAERGLRLVYGGGRVGLMGAAADAALAAGGEVVGVLPAALERREVGHRGLTELVVVGSMHERKALMAERADGFVALPGGLGTLEELVEAATWTQLGIHAKPVALLDAAGFWDDLRRLLDHAVRERFLRPQHRGLLRSATTPDAALDALAAWTPQDTDKWMEPGAPRPDVPPRGPLVGVSAIVVRDGHVLLGRRRGAHGAGTWSFPGGKVDPGEAPGAAAARELAEETGLVAEAVAPAGWTDDRFPDDGLHFVTLHHVVRAGGEPVVREPEKVEGWSWHHWDALPEPLFAPVAALRATGWRPPAPS
jgi:uncharacterized protein (TIGR00730 family)